MDILRDCLRGNATNFIQGLSADNRGTAAPEGAVGMVLARLDHTEEQGLLMPGVLFLVMLDRILVVEFLGHLDKGKLLVLKISECPIQEIRLGDHVGIQDYNEFPSG